MTRSGIRRLGLALTAMLFLPNMALADDDDWTPLFNGRDLTGWKVYSEAVGDSRAKNDIVRVSDGELHFYPNGNAAEGAKGYLATETGYSFYRLRFEYRWDGAADAKRDSGVLVHVVGADRSCRRFRLPSRNRRRSCCRA